MLLNTHRLTHPPTHPPPFPDTPITRHGHWTNSTSCKRLVTNCSFRIWHSFIHLVRGGEEESDTAGESTETVVQFEHTGTPRYLPSTAQPGEHDMSHPHGMGWGCCHPHSQLVMGTRKHTHTHTHTHTQDPPPVWRRVGCHMWGVVDTVKATGSTCKSPPPARPNLGYANHGAHPCARLVLREPK